MKNKGNIWYYIENYKFNSLFIKNFILIFLLFVVPVGGITAVVYANTNEMMKEDISAISINSLYRVKDMMDTLFNDIERLATKISLESDVQVFMMTDDLTSFDTEKRKSILKITNAYPLMYRYISSIYIYSEKNKFLISNSGGGNIDVLDDTTWYDRYLEKEDNDPWIQARKHNNNYPYYITIAKPTGISYVKESMGAVIININPEEVGKILLRTENNITENIYILDKNGIILFNKEIEKITTHIRDMGLLENISDLKEDYVGEIILHNEKYVVVSVASRYHDGRYVSLIPFKIFQVRLDRIKIFIIALLIICIIISFVCAYIISIKTFKPIQNIMSLVENPGNWNEKALKDKKYKSGEFEYIAERIMSTIYSNKELKQELDKRMSLMEKAQSTALQAQINPHFLYNTLESINWKAIRLTKGKNDVSKMLTLLSNLLRLSMDSNEPLIPISEEIEHAKCYVDIIKMRYTNRVNVLWQIDEEIFSYKIVKLILQPIIENAIYHGIMPKRQEGNIQIKGELEGSLILIDISDDGIGMSEEETRVLNNSMKNEVDFDSEHIGLMNVNHRVKLMFGSAYGVKIESVKGEGSVVNITIPVVK